MFKTNNDIKLIVKYFKDKPLEKVLDITNTSDTLCSMLSVDEVATENIDIAISKDGLHLVSNIKGLLEDTANVTVQGGYLVISDIVVDIEDARLNSYQFALDSKHIRYYTVREIVAIASENGYSLQLFQQIDEPVDVSQNKQYSRFINKASANITNKLTAVGETGRYTSFSLKRGVFVFKKY